MCADPSLNSVLPFNVDEYPTEILIPTCNEGFNASPAIVADIVLAFQHGNAVVTYKVSAFPFKKDDELMIDPSYYSIAHA